MFLFIKKWLLLKPFQILCTIIFFIIIAPYLTIEQYNFLYTISTIIKDSLLFILPFTIFAYIATSLMGFRNKAGLLIISVIIFEAISNASSIFYAYGLHKLFPINFELSINSYEIKQLNSYVSLSKLKPSWWKVERGAILGLIVGLYIVYAKKEKYWFKYVTRSRNVANYIFTKIFSKLILILIPGFIANLIYNNTLTKLVVDCKFNLLIMILFMIFYIIFLFFLGSNFSVKDTLRKCYNAFPSMITAFTTMCSIITMPVTIANAKKNLKNPKYATTIIPMTTNIQMIGDCFVNAFLCLVVIRVFGYNIPEFSQWFKFTLIFTLVRYATAGVSGGTTFLLLPLYEKYLAFNNEMLAIMITFNVILDPIITAANVYANGALVLIFEKVFNFISLIFDNKTGKNVKKISKSYNI